MKKTRGITLVALVITIIIIIILSTVAISLAFGDNGLIKGAEDASRMYANDTEYTEGSITNVESYINDILIGVGESGGEPETPSEVEQAKESGKVFTDSDNPISDEEGNKIKIPAGFKIAEDSGDTVQQGIVIEDVSASTDTAVQGSQFVWIPVGTFTKDDGTPSKEIILGRYTFDRTDGTPILKQAAYTDEEPTNYLKEVEITPLENTRIYTESATYREGVASTQVGVGQNATAHDLNGFVESVKQNGGYYFGRYEASFASGTSADNYKAASKISISFSEESMSYSSGTLWNFVTQLDASKASINTYADSTSVKSDLINSYTWDTAIVYIQEAGNKNYANAESKCDELSNTGNLANGIKDEACKINNMASNMVELTTESSTFVMDNIVHPCVVRGEYYRTTYNYWAAIRGNTYPTSKSAPTGFRLILYVE